MDYWTQAPDDSDLPAESASLARTPNHSDWWMTVAIWASFGLALICFTVLLFS